MFLQISLKTRCRTNEKKDAFEAMCEVKALAYAMKDELLKGNLHSFGKLLDYGWQSKKRMSNKISNPQIDELYAEALKAGALGGKLLGAGGGGYLLMYCPYNVRHKWQPAWSPWADSWLTGILNCAVPRAG